MNMIFNMVATVLVSTLDCDFDVNKCTWCQGDADDFDWTRHTGPTVSDDTGPNADHTTGKNELSQEKLFWGFRIVSTKAELNSHRFTAIFVQLIYGKIFVSACAKGRFSHNVAHIQ